MRVRMIRKPPVTYSNGFESDALLTGRVYNLAPALASALMLDGYAELYETLTDEEKHERSAEATHQAWTADDHSPHWDVPEKPDKPARKRRKKR
jgi:hypothetical protein